MKYLIILFTLCFSNMIFSQAPQKMSYQATIRDASNNLISQKNVGIKISIVKDEPNGNPLFIETHLAVSNLNGLISFQIGAGFKIFGDFSSINWGDGSYYIKTEIDPDGGYDFKINGTSELLSVPFAFYAEKSKSVFDTTSIYHSIGNLEKQSIENKNNILINIDSIKSSAFKIQKNIDDILLNNKNIQNNVDSLGSKISKIDLDNLLLNYQKLGKFVTAISLLGVDSFDIKINGNLTASKNVTVGGNIEALGSTSTLGTLEKPFKGLFISSGSLSIASDTLGQDIPAAVLSNVRGNLEISAGGLKLVGTDEAFIAPRIVSTLTGNASTASKLDTARKINGIAFDGSKDITIATTASNAITYTNTGTGDVPGGSYNGSLAKTISYNSIGASPLAGSTLITSVGALSAGAIPYTLLTGTVPIWNQSTSGNAATVTTNANLTGVITSIGNVTTISSGTITNSMIANIAVANLSGTNTGDQTNITGNAGTATKLAATKLINGVAFDGSSDIIIATSSANAITYTNTGTGDVPGGSYNGSLAKTISYNSIGASPLAGSTLITSVGTLSAGAIPYTLLTGTVPIWNQSTSGNAATVTTNANLTGFISSLGNVTSIASGSITNSMIANTAVANLSGTNTGDQILPTLASLGGVASNTAITGATKTKITYDAKGLVTAGADATTADIVASANKNYVTDIQAGVISNTLGTNTGDETTSTIKTKLGITTLTGSNTGDQILPTLASLGGVASNTVINGATKTKITYDAKGLVIAGADATTADIVASANKNYVTDVQAGVISNTLGTNTGDETTSTIKTKLGITTLTGSNTGDQILPTLASLGGVASNTVITGSTKTKITYDAKGLVTAGADATTADIAASTNKNYVTDVQAGVISNTSGTNTGDNAINSNYSGLVSNATHTGDATGSTSLTVVRINGTSLAGLGTGILKNTTGTGVPSIAIANDFPTFNQSTSGNAATVTTNANLTGPITSSGNTTSVTSQTGTGSKFVMDGSPTLITPVLGVASATTINKVAITAPTTSATLTIIDGSSLITAGAFAITLTSTAATNVTLPTTGTLATTGTLVKVTSLISGTTFTKQASTNMLVVYIVAAGGGGGGVVAITGTGFSGAAGGGGGGEVRIVRVTAPSASAYTISLGIGGIAGANTGGTGGTGGTTTWDVNALSATITAIGGSGGVGITNNNATTTGAGGAGGTGGTGVVDASFQGFSGVSGGAGGSPFGGFGTGAASSFIVTSGSVAGNDGGGFGAGGSGAVTFAPLATNSTANTGGVGASGMIIVYEYK